MAKKDNPPEITGAIGRGGGGGVLGFGDGEWGMGNGEWGMGNWDCHCCAPIDLPEV